MWWPPERGLLVVVVLLGVRRSEVPHVLCGMNHPLWLERPRRVLRWIPLLGLRVVPLLLLLLLGRVVAPVLVHVRTESATGGSHGHLRGGEEQRKIE